MDEQSDGSQSSRKRTPSFVLELPLKVTPTHEHALNARFEAGRQLYNACLGEAKRRMLLVRESKLSQRARTLPKDDPERAKLFSQARARYAFREYDLHTYAGDLRRSWIGEHIDSLTAQKLASRAYKAANLVLLGRARRVRFKGKNQMGSLEGKNNESGIKWRTDHIEWQGLLLPALIDKRDPVHTHGLAARVKFVRLVRRKLGERERYYVQLVCEGAPYRKPQHTLGEGRVGLDLGPSSIAIVSDQQARLSAFCPEVVPAARKLRRLDRHLDRQRRANNPDNYDEKGSIKRGEKRWRSSKRQLKTQARRREYYRKLAATRKSSQGQLAHQVLAQGTTVALEKLSYHGWQKRYGKSIHNRAPGMFVSRLSCLAESAGATVIEIVPRRAKLSQTCVCGAIKKKPLAQRWHQCDCGASAQRDLFSAFLARFVDRDTHLLDVGQAHAAWQSSDPILQAAHQQAISHNQPASGQSRLPSFGVRPRPSQSRSLAEGSPVNAEIRDAVPKPQGGGRARKRRR